MSEFLACTKELYKDLITVAKDEETGEIKPRSMIFRLDGYTTNSGSKTTFDSHPQEFFYVLVDPLNWHATVFANKWSRKW